MEHAALLPGSSSTPISDSSVDLDVLEELLSSDDVWFNVQGLEDLLQQGSSTPSTPLGPSNLPPCNKALNVRFNATLEGDAHSALKKIPSFLVPLQAGAEVGKNLVDDQFNSFARAFPPNSIHPEPGEAVPGWDHEPETNSVPLSTVQDRLNQALTFLRNAYGGGEMLIQIWVPIKNGNKQVLSTCGQPFSLNPHCHRLLSYRQVSADYQFSAEGNSGEALGLPGRVFLGKVPEWSPDVRYFSRSEYPRVNYARRYDVRGTLALPIVDRSTRTCLGVLETVMTTEKISYRSDLETICCALQAVDLGSTEVFGVPHLKMNCDSYLIALSEISTVLRAVCQAHGLPLAQTWMPCIQQGRTGSRHLEENYKDCVSTVDAAWFVNDPSLSSFHEECSEHHLLRGQGVVGRAFMTNQPCFSSSITSFSKSEYPLSHHARMFGLQAAVAIRLRSINSGSIDFVLEFFLPKDCIKSEDQRLMLSSLSTTIRQVCQTLRVVTSKELEDENALLVNEHVNGFHGSSERSFLDSAVEVSNPQEHWVSDVVKPQLKEKRMLEFRKETVQGFSEKDCWGRPNLGFSEDEILSKGHQSSGKDMIEYEDPIDGEPSSSIRDKTTKKKRAKLEKTISLRDLQQYFSGSLKDAAKSIGVCPTTLKRICRRHGITRWPSRKIKKVGDSLRKLQVVINSIQGVDDAFQFRSMCTSVANGIGSNVCTQSQNGSEMICMPNQGDDPKANVPHGPFISHASGSDSRPSSCSQNSGSSHSFSSEGKQSSDTMKLSRKKEVPHGDHGAILKRAHSQLEFYHSDQRTFKTMARSQSLKAFDRHHVPGYLPPPCQRGADSRPRVKAIYGKEKTRFKLQTTWGFQELKQNISKRFNISAAHSPVLKYLDDDSEWVLLTCDDDLLECIDIYRSSNNSTIKISVDHVGNPSAISLGCGR